MDTPLDGEVYFPADPTTPGAVMPCCRVSVLIACSAKSDSRPHVYSGSSSAPGDLGAIFSPGVPHQPQPGVSALPPAGGQSPWDRLVAASASATAGDQPLPVPPDLWGYDQAAEPAPVQDPGRGVSAVEGMSLGSARSPASRGFYGGPGAAEHKAQGNGGASPVSLSASDVNGQGGANGASGTGARGAAQDARDHSGGGSSAPSNATTVTTSSLAVPMLFSPQAQAQANPMMAMLGAGGGDAGGPASDVRLRPPLMPLTPTWCCVSCFLLDAMLTLPSLPWLSGPCQLAGWPHARSPARCRHTIYRRQCVRRRLSAGPGRTRGHRAVSGPGWRLRRL